MVSSNNINAIKNKLLQDVKTFQGGNLKYFSKNWCKYTKDPYILGIITNGLQLELIGIPKHNNMPKNPLSKNEIGYFNRN